LKYLFVKVLFVLALSIFFLPDALRAQDKAKIAALETQLASANNDNDRLRILGDLCWNYSFTSFDKALDYGKQELDLAQKMRNDTAVALAYSDIGIVHIRANNLKEALIFNQKAYDLRKKLGLKNKMAGSLTNLAVIYKQLGNYDKAVQNMSEALHIYTEAGDEAKQALVLNNIGKFYLDNNKPEDAKNYLLQSLSLAKKLNQKALEANARGNLMGYYLKKEQFADGIKMGDIALKICKELGDENSVATIYNTLGVIYQKTKQYDKALEYNQQSIAIREGLKDQLGVGSCYKNIASIYIEQEKFTEADIYLKKAIAVFNQLKAKNYLQEAYTLAASMNEKQNTYKEALVNMQLSQKIKDSLFNRKTADKINELQIKYETEKKEQSIRLLNKQTIIQQLQIGKRNTTILIICGVFLVAIAFAGMFYGRYKLKQDARLQAEVIRQQDMAAKGIIEAEERERKRIAGDLHDGVGQLFSAVKMNMNGLFERMSFTNDTERVLAEKTLALVDESCVEVRSIAHQMMPNVLLKMGLVSAVKDFVNKIDADKLKVLVETAGLNERLDNDVEIVLYRVIQECVNNVIKHARASVLDIQLIHEDGEVAVTIEDNGRGFDTADKEKFEGIGLKNIITRVEYLKGTIEVSSAPGRGTLIAIHVPVS
jgi:two-component system NarL family sensor kinase